MGDAILGVNINFIPNKLFEWKRALIYDLHAFHPQHSYATLCLQGHHKLIGNKVLRFRNLHRHFILLGCDNFQLGYNILP